MRPKACVTPIWEAGTARTYAAYRVTSAGWLAEKDRKIDVSVAAFVDIYLSLPVLPAEMFLSRQIIIIHNESQ